MNLNFTFILQIASFLILLFLLGKFLYKPFTKFLDDKAEEARHMIDGAKESEEKARLYAEQTHQALDMARQEALKLKEEAKRGADKERRSIVSQAKKEAQRVIEEAKKQIKKEEEGVAKRIKGKVGELSLDVAAKILGREIKKDDHKRLIEDSIKEIESGSH